MITILTSIVTFWLVFWIFENYFPYSHKSSKIKPTQSVDGTVFSNMILSFIAGPIIWYSVPDFSHYLTDNYILRFLICILVSDFWFYFIHILFHQTSLYKWHKLHHQFYETYPLVALYASPFEAIFCDFLAIGIGPAMLNMSTYEMQIWMIFMALHALTIHSTLYHGVDHTVHHSRLGCNYGLFSIADRVFGTYRRNQVLLQEE